MPGPLTSPYAPDSRRVDQAFRIADLMRQQGYAAAETKGRGLQTVSDLVSTGGGILMSTLNHREELKKQQDIADLLASGEDFDPKEIIAKYGMETATKAYGLYQAMQPKYNDHNPEDDLVDQHGNIKIKGTGRAARGGLSPEEQDSVLENAEMIFSGKASPMLTGMYRLRPYIQAELNKKGFNLANAETDWKATQRYLQTMNGTPNIRMQSAIYTADHSLDVIADLAEQWDALDKTAWDGQYNLLNRVSLEFAKGGALGQQAQLVAQQLDTQINDVSSELGQMYMGGTSPTDYALKMGAENLKGQWSKPTLLGLVKQAKGNIRIRQNSLNLGPVGVGDNPYYTPPPPQPIQPPPPYSAPPPGPSPDPTPNTRAVAPPVAPPPVSALVAPPSVAPPGPPPGPPPAAPPAYPFTGGQRQRVEPFRPPVAPPVIPPPPVTPPPVTPQAVAPPSTAPAASVGRRPVAPAPPGMVTLINPRKNNQELHVPAAEVAEALRAGALYPNGTTAPSAPGAPPETGPPATDPDSSPDPYENAVLMRFKDGQILWVSPQDEQEATTGGAVYANLTGPQQIALERKGAIGLFTGKKTR